jgi:hypothetical protein
VRAAVGSHQASRGYAGRRNTGHARPPKKDASN